MGLLEKKPKAEGEPTKEDMTTGPFKNYREGK